jgi:hypothetical protein
LNKDVRARPGFQVQNRRMKMPYLSLQLQITSNEGAPDAKDRLDNMSLSEHVQVIINGTTFQAEVLDYEVRG